MGQSISCLKSKTTRKAQVPPQAVTTRESTKHAGHPTETSRQGSASHDALRHAHTRHAAERKPFPTTLRKPSSHKTTGARGAHAGYNSASTSGATSTSFWAGGAGGYSGGGGDFGGGGGDCGGGGGDGGGGGGGC